MNPRRLRTLALATCLLAFPLATVAAAAATAPAETTLEPGQVEPAPDVRPSEHVQRMARDLDALAVAWADGGGTFGFPYWEKAQQRWISRDLSASAFREYVTGYRDRLTAGCRLLDAVETDSDASDEVAALVRDACSDRRDALRTQQRYLDLVIERDTIPPLGRSADVEDVEARTERIDELDAEAAELEVELHEDLDGSYRNTRLAMDMAQAALHAEGLEPLDEDAFM